MAGVPVDFNEDDFEEYNPHPYLGGYDIAKTYGSPLPPSTDICYPNSSGSAPVVSSPKLPSENLPIKDTVPSAPVPVVETPITPPLVEQPRFEPYEYGEGYKPEPYKPDFFRSWPYSNSDYYTCKGRRGEVRDRDYWNQLMKGLDFLFGHSHGFGERRVGTDIYGIPIYANKKTGTESVLVQVEQPSVQKIEYYEDFNHSQNQNWSSNYEETKEENSYTYNNDYQNHNSNYPYTYQDSGYNNEGSSYYAGENGSREENDLINTSIYSYNQHYFEKPLHVELEPNESTWTQNLISHENYPSYSEKYEEDHENSYQSYENENSYQSYENKKSYQSNEQYQYESLEPYNPSWSQNTGYYNNYFEGEPISSNQHHSISSFEGTNSEYNKDSSYYDVSNWVDYNSQKLSDEIFGSSHNYYAYDQ